MDYSRRATAALRESLSLPERGLGAVDCVIEASGAEVCVQMGCFLVREEGVYVQVGMGSPDVQIPLTAFATKQARFVGSFRYGAGDYVSPTFIRSILFDFVRSLSLSPTETDATSSCV